MSHDPRNILFIEVASRHRVASIAWIDRSAGYSIVVPQWSYSKADFVGLNNALKSISLVDIVEGENDIDLAWIKWKDAFLSAVDSYVPKVNLKRSYTPPYITSDLLHAINKKESLRRKAKVFNSPFLWEKFRQARKKIKCWINACKREYISGLAESLHTNLKAFWRFFKAKSSKSSLPDVMKTESSKLFNAQEKAVAFNRYFASVFTTNTSQFSPLTPRMPPSHQLNYISVSLAEVEKLLSKLSPTKACGFDSIPARILKESAGTIAPSLTALFNMSLHSGKIPTEWKLANVVPVPKKGDPHSIYNYRPVSLLSLVSKLLEHAVFNKVSAFIQNYLYDLQHGFRHKRSCITQLLSVFHEIGRMLDSGHEIDLIYLDFSKAFDSVPHQKLLAKLSAYGISGTLLNWFTDYLNNRKQRVVVEGVSSPFLSVTSGVPQGSVIAPLLFLIYSNDLPEAALNSRVAMFADDSKCYRTIKCPGDREFLQRDLSALHQWSVSWDLSFNASKCFLLRISRKRTQSDHSYSLGSELINSAPSQNDLGVIVGSDLKWSLHIRKCIAKANRMLGFLRRNCSRLTSMRCRRLLYLSLVRSHLSYGSELWGPQNSSNDLRRLEGVQRRATKFILQDYTSSYLERLKKINLLPLSYWLEMKDLLFFFKCKSGQFDLNISKFVSFSHSSCRSLRSSSANILQSASYKTSLFQKSFFNRIVFLWNDLPSSIRASSSFTSFKTQLINHYTAKRDNNFDVNQQRTWKTYCYKCNSYNINCCS